MFKRLFGVQLPVPKTQRTIFGAGVAIVRMPIYMMNKGKRLVLMLGKPPDGMVEKEWIGRKLMRKADLRIRKSSPIEMALKFAEVLREPSVVSKAQVARRFGVSRARVCQMLKLLQLDDSILDFIMATTDSENSDHFTERRLRPIAAVQDRNQQVRMFNELGRELYPNQQSNCPVVEKSGKFLRRNLKIEKRLVIVMDSF